MALRSKGIQGQSANTVGAQISAQGSRNLAGGIAAAFGGVAQGVVRKKEMDFRAEQNKQDRDLRAEQGRLNRGAAIDAAKIRAKSRMAASLISDHKATQARAAKSFEEFRQFQALAAEIDGDGKPVPDEITARIEVLKGSLGAMANLMQMTSDRMAQEGVKAPEIDSVPDLDRKAYEIEIEQKQLESQSRRLESSKMKSEGLKSVYRNRLQAKRLKLAKELEQANIRKAKSTEDSEKELGDAQNRIKAGLQARGLLKIGKEYAKTGHVTKMEYMGLAKEVADRSMTLEMAEDTLQMIYETRKKKADDKAKADASAEEDKKTKVEEKTRLKQDEKDLYEMAADLEHVDEGDVKSALPFLREKGGYKAAWKELQKLDKERREAKANPIKPGSGRLKVAEVTPAEEKQGTYVFDPETIASITEPEFAADLMQKAEIGWLRAAMIAKYPGIMSKSPKERAAVAKRLRSLRPEEEQARFSSLMLDILKLRK